MDCQGKNAAPEAVAVATWLGFAAMCIGMFMAILDVQIVATSLPTIGNALAVEPDRISWLQTAYLVSEVVAIATTGLLTRALSMRWLYVGAVTAFAAASLGCAASDSFTDLVAWRVIQGFAGGTLIPAVFSAVFLLFPFRRQGLATTLAGVLAVLAPTVGPIAGGWITATYSWHWLFLVNVAPGIVAAVSTVAFLPAGSTELGELASVDPGSLLGLGGGLAALEVGLKEAPGRGWLSLPVLGLLLVAALAAAIFVRRSRTAAVPVVDLGLFRERRFVFGCALSFACGFGLFGSVYLMPVFLGYVRGHDALETGSIMLTTGLAQLLVAPIAVAAERRLDARWLTAFGFAAFAAGSLLSVGQTVGTDAAGMFWPQVVRGAAIMFCLLPPTRIALGDLPPDKVGDASSLFNLMRNLGGAIGLALIDTVVYGLSPGYASELTSRLQAGDTAAATMIGISPELLASKLHTGVDAATQALVAPLIQRAALTQAIGEAWLLIGAVAIAAVILVPFAWKPRAAAARSPGRLPPAPHSLRLSGSGE